MNKPAQPPQAASPAPVALLTGDDTIGREKAKADLLAAIYREHPDAAEERFDSSLGPFSQFAARILTPSLFAAARVFHIRHANQLAKDDAEELGRLVRYEIPDVYLIIEFDEDDEGGGKAAKGGKGAASAVIKGSVKNAGGRVAVMDFVKPPDYKIPVWLTTQVPRLFGRSIGKDDAEYLIECVGADLDVLYSELQKIDIHLKPRAPVDREAIETICASTRMQTGFELARALGERDLPAALDILDSLFSTAFYAPPCVAMIFRHFWGLYRIRAFAKANPDVTRRYLSGGGGYEAQTALAHRIGIAAGLLDEDAPVKKAYPVIILSRAVEQAQGFGEEDVRRILEWLRDFDVDIKTGRVEADKGAVQLLCYKIVRAGCLEKSAAR